MNVTNIITKLLPVSAKLSVYYLKVDIDFACPCHYVVELQGRGDKSNVS